MAYIKANLGGGAITPTTLTLVGSVSTQFSRLYAADVNNNAVYGSPFSGQYFNASGGQTVTITSKVDGLIVKGLSFTCNNGATVVLTDAVDTVLNTNESVSLSTPTLAGYYTDGCMINCYIES